MNLNNPPSNVNINIGFRAALPETSEKAAAYGRSSQAQAKEPWSLSRLLYGRQKIKHARPGW